MRIYLFLLALLSQAICAEPLFYYHVGATWTYLVDGSNASQVTNTVSEARTVKDKRWYKLQEFGKTFWVSNVESGQVDTINFEPLEEPEENPVFKYPAKVGETWSNIDSSITYKGQETITVPAGTFECHVYIIDMANGNYSNSCIAKNIGIVYYEVVDNNDIKKIFKLIKHEK